MVSWSPPEIHEGEGGFHVNYDICCTKLKFGERAFTVVAPKAWNSLPDFLKHSIDVVKFRKGLKTHLFNLAYN